MPTKPNRAGEQQPYVPAGNGDASGEYGDNATGSNKHFTNFKKNETPIEPKQVEEKKKETRINELTPKQKFAIGKFAKYYARGGDADKIRNLRYFSGEYGDLSKFSDQDLLDILREYDNWEVSNEVVWFKNGSKWVGTGDKGLLDIAGIKYYTKEEKENKIAEDNQKLVQSSQKKQDIEIQNIMGSNCVVCFGKGYKEEDLNEIVNATRTLIDEFPDLKDSIKMIGDRNNLEKLINARREQMTFSEEEIAKQIEKEKSYYYGGLPSEETLREKAIKSLTGGTFKLTKLQRAYAYWSKSIKALVYMGSMKNVTQQQKDYEFNTNFKSSNHKQSTYYHEMGHAIDYMLEDLMHKKGLELASQDYQTQVRFRIIEQEYRQAKSGLIAENGNANYLKEFEKEYISRFGETEYANRWGPKKIKQNDQVEKALSDRGIKAYNVSKYGATNDAEFIAECFSAHYTGMNNPLATKMVNLMKETIKKIKEFK